MLTMWVMSKLRRELGAINNNGFSHSLSPAPGHLYITITKGSPPCTSVFCFHFHQGIFACPFVLSYVVCAMIWMSGVLWYLLLEEGRRVADIYIYFSKMVMSRLNLVKNINTGLKQKIFFLTYWKTVFWVTKNFCIKWTFWKIPFFCPKNAFFWKKWQSDPQTSKD